jgi:hypothetical protein
MDLQDEDILEENREPPIDLKPFIDIFRVSPCPSCPRLLMEVEDDRTRTLRSQSPSQSGGQSFQADRAGRHDRLHRVLSFSDKARALRRHIPVLVKPCAAHTQTE